jgi:hypothetical protein
MRRVFYQGAAHLLEWEMSQAKGPQRGKVEGVSSIADNLFYL